MVITSFTQAIEASRPHATTNSSKFPVRSNDAPTLAGSYHVDILHGATDFSLDKNLVENGLQRIPLAGTAELEPGDDTVSERVTHSQPAHTVAGPGPYCIIVFKVSAVS